MAPDAAGNSAEFPKEFALLLACCKCAFGRGSIGPSAFGGIDWTRFVRIAAFHRVEGLVWKSLAPCAAAIPKEISRDLSNTAAEIGASNLRAAAECRGLLSDFEAAGVPLLFLKGLTLGVLAYGNASLKSAIDIDLLIDPGDLDRASALLANRGYRLIIPKNGDARLDRWHRRSKESVWARQQPALQIDLHTRTADSPRLIAGIDVHAPRQMVDVGSGIQLPTLSDEQLFAYLAVHGAWSAWFRLKWIADVAGFLAERSAKKIGSLYRNSHQLGASRAAGQALLLADRLFGTLASATELRIELAADRSTRLLCDGALRIVASERGEPTARRFGTIPIHLLELLLVPGIFYKVAEVARQVRTSFGNR